MNKRNHMARLLITGTLILITACMSRTLFSDRVRESRGLQASVTVPTVANPTQFRFCAVGDLHIAGGDTTRFQKILQSAVGQGCEFFVFLGDIVDQGDARDVDAFRAAADAGGFKDKFLPVIGNHDVFFEGWKSYRNSNGPSFYSVDIGNARFVVLDTADGAIGDEQLSWLEEQLKTAPGRQKILLSHYLPFIPGRLSYLRLANERDAGIAMALAEKYDVTAWLGAHYHSYIVERRGKVSYVVAGGGGGRRMPPVLDYFYVVLDLNSNGIAVSPVTIP